MAKVNNCETEVHNDLKSFNEISLPQKEKPKKKNIFWRWFGTR